MAVRRTHWLPLFLVAALFVVIPARAGAAAPVIAAAGDIGCQFGFKPEGAARPLISSEGSPRSDHACQQAATARLIRRPGDYNAVLALGDLLGPAGSLADYRRSYGPSWGAFRSITLPAVGNHDYQRGSAEGYFGYFNGRRVGRDGDGWYRRRLGHWLVIGLNSVCNRVECSGDSRQVRWLKRLLRSNRKAIRRGRGSRCILAFWHHPRFSSGRHGGTHDVGAFWRTLRRFGGDVILNGHDHLYERFMPLAPSGAADPEGITQFTVGTGGRSLFRFDGEPHPGSEVRIERRFGILRLRLFPRAFRWNFVTTNREVLDQGTRRCNAKNG